MPGKPGLRGPLHPLQHLVNINRRAIQWTIRNKAAHTINQRANPVGLATDQAGQFLIRPRDDALQKLRGAPNA